MNTRIHTLTGVQDVAPSCEYVPAGHAARNRIGCTCCFGFCMFLYVLLCTIFAACMLFHCG